MTAIIKQENISEIGVILSLADILLRIFLTFNKDIFLTEDEKYKFEDEKYKLFNKKIEEFQHNNIKLIINNPNKLETSKLVEIIVRKYIKSDNNINLKLIIIKGLKELNYLQSLIDKLEEEYNKFISTMQVKPDELNQKRGS